MNTDGSGFIKEPPHDPGCLDKAPSGGNGVKTKYALKVSLLGNSGAPYHLGLQVRIVCKQEIFVAGEGGRGLPQSKTLARSPYCR